MVLEKRSQARAKAQIDAECRVRGIAHRATLTNVSNYGCCAVLERIVALPGDRLMVKATNLLQVPATVKWIKGGQVGLEFANPLVGGMLSQFAHDRGSRH